MVILRSAFTAPTSYLKGTGDIRISKTVASCIQVLQYIPRRLQAASRHDCIVAFSATSCRGPNGLIATADRLKGLKARASSSQSGEASPADHTTWSPVRDPQGSDQGLFVQQQGRSRQSGKLFSVTRMPQVQQATGQKQLLGSKGAINTSCYVQVSSQAAPSSLTSAYTTSMK